eukprot:jgi/Phyca11/541756/estExt2_Genewise1Plus.C_PHYCAscaffold_70636
MAGLGSLEALATDPVVIPYSRLTRPDTDLSMELRDCPLLPLYRFVRFNACYLQRDHRYYREVPLDSFLVGQVVSYFPTHGRTFTTPAGAALQPACDHYVCGGSPEPRRCALASRCRAQRHRMAATDSRDEICCRLVSWRRCHSSTDTQAIPISFSMD